MDSSLLGRPISSLRDYRETSAAMEGEARLVELAAQQARLMEEAAKQARLLEQAARQACERRAPFHACGAMLEFEAAFSRHPLLDALRLDWVEGDYNGCVHVETRGPAGELVAHLGHLPTLFGADELGLAEREKSFAAAVDPLRFPGLSPAEFARQSKACQDELESIFYLLLDKASALAQHLTEHPLARKRHAQNQSPIRIEAGWDAARIANAFGMPEISLALERASLAAAALPGSPGPGARSL